MSMSVNQGPSTTQLPADIYNLTEDGGITKNGEPTDLEQANAALNPIGLQVNQSGFSSVGNTGNDSNHLNVVSNFGDNPLPDVTGPAASSEELSASVSNLSSYDDGGAGALMWMAMSELARVSQREMKDAKDLRNAMQHSKIQSKQTQIESTEAQFEAERSAAIQNLVVQVGASVISMTGVGNLGSQQLSAAGQLITAAGNALVKNIGAGREANEAQLKTKRHEMMEAIDDQAIESAKGNYEDAKEQFKLAMRVLQETSERMTQVIQKITS